jgi:hypothetical protein
VTIDEELLLFKKMSVSAEYFMKIYNVHFYTCIEVIEGLEEEYGEENTTWFYNKCRNKSRRKE